jgi:ATP-dependent Clp protease ATP-binding subunit ClpA
MFEVFEGFTAQANTAIWLSRRVAWWMRHNFVSPEILLLGMIGERDCAVAKVLRSMGVSFDDAQVEVENCIGRGSEECAPKVPLTSSVHQILQAARDRAKDLGVDYVSTTHIMLALMAAEDNRAITALTNLGVDLTKLEEQLKQGLAKEKIETAADTGLHNVGLGVVCKIGKTSPDGSKISLELTQTGAVEHIDLSKPVPEILRASQEILPNSDEALDEIFGVQTERDEFWASLLRSEKKDRDADHTDKP